MNIELLFTGNELLDGQVLNSNEQDICQILNENGFEINTATTVGDERLKLAQTIELITKRTDILIMTGGLGPTEDDRTSEVVALISKKKLIQYPEAIDHINSFYKKLNRKMPEINSKQTFFPESAKLIHNKLGSAPGFQININKAIIIALPGIPSEMNLMMKDEVLPKILKVLQKKEIIKTKTFKTFGLGESNLQEKIQDIYPLPNNTELSFRVKFPEVHLKIKTKDKNKSKIEETLSELTSKINYQLDKYIFGTEQDNFIQNFANLMIKNNIIVSLAESCTGGLIAEMITKESGASQYFSYGVISYSNHAKNKILNVPLAILNKNGAVSKETCEAMVTNVRKLAESDLGIAVTGIAGPEGGTEEKPVGTVYIGTSFKESLEIKHFEFKGSRNRIQILTTYNAIKMAINLVKTYDK